MLKETPRSIDPHGQGAVEDGGTMSAAVAGLPRRFQKGEFLFVEGDTSRGVFILKTGSVKLSTCLPDGKLVIVYVAHPGSILGLSGVLGASEHEVTAEAIEPTYAEFLTSQRVHACLESDPRFAVRVANEMARRYRSAHSLACTLAKSDPILVKLARLVKEWTSDGASAEQTLENVITHQQIAEMLGTTRETVTRAFRQLRECGVLTLKGHTLTVHDLHKLYSLAEGCDVPHRL